MKEKEEERKKEHKISDHQLLECIVTPVDKIAHRLVPGGKVELKVVLLHDSRDHPPALQNQFSFCAEEDCPNLQHPRGGWEAKRYLKREGKEKRMNIEHDNR